MDANHHQNRIDRRAFLKIGAVGVVTIAATRNPLTVAQDIAQPEQKREPVFRTLGRTGLKVSVVGVGAMITTEPAVLQAAFDRGVNYIDTARSYAGGKNEQIVGQAIKGRRDKIIVATKCSLAPDKDGLIRAAEESLRALDTDHIDVFQLHGPSKESILQEHIKEAFSQLRQQGKIRFTGLSAHSDQGGVIDTMIQDPAKFFDVVLVAYNFTGPKEVKDAIARAAAAGLGVVAMKTQAGGYKTKELGNVSPHQAALKWVLQDANIHTTIPSMVDLKQVEEDTEVMGMALSRTDEQALARYGQAIRPYYCHMCRQCAPECPWGVDVSSVNRCIMYAEGYGDMQLARAAYAELPPAASAAVCRNCEFCTVRCPNGLDIAAKMRKAQTVFGRHTTLRT